MNYSINLAHPIYTITVFNYSAAREKYPFCDDYSKSAKDPNVFQIIQTD